MRFRYKATMDDMMMVTKVGIARLSRTDPQRGDGLVKIRRWGLVVMIAGLALVGVAAAGFAGVGALSPVMRITSLWGGLALASLGWTLRKLNLDVGELLDGAMKHDSLAANPDLQKTVDEMGEVEVEITSDGVTIDNGKQRATYRWPEIRSVRLMGEYLVLEGHGMAGAMVLLPLRALPDGTNVEALIAMLYTLRSDAMPSNPHTGGRC